MAGWQDDPVVDEAPDPGPAKPSWQADPVVSSDPAYPGADNLGVFPIPPPKPTGDTLRASYRAVQDVNPDEQGKVIRISRDTGIPPAIVQADPDGAAKSRPPTQLELLPSHAPSLAAHVQQPQNMAAAKDDLAKLSTLEWTLTGGLVTGAAWDAEPLKYQPPVWLEALRKGWSGVRQGLEKTRQELGLDPSWTQILYPFSTSDLSEAQRAERAAPDVVAAARDLQARSTLAKAWVGGFQAAPFLVGNVAAAAGGGVPGMVAFNTATVYGENVEQIGQIQGPKGESGASPGGRALATALSVGEGAIYSIGLGRLGKTLAGPVAKRIPGEIVNRVMSSPELAKTIGKLVLRFGEAEVEGAATMAAASALQSAGQEFAKSRVDENHDFDTTPVVDQAERAFKQGLTDFALISAFGAARRGFYDLGISRLSSREAQTLRESGKAVKDSKLADRDPTSVEDLIAQTAPGQSVLVDRDVWNQYWREKGTDPRAKAAEVAGDDGASFDLSERTQYLALPLSKALVRLGKTEHWQALLQDAKLSPEARTPNEETAAQAERSAQATSLPGQIPEAPDFTLWRPGEGPPPIPLTEREAPKPPLEPQGPHSDLPSPLARQLYPELWKAPEESALVRKLYPDIDRRVAQSAIAYAEATAGLGEPTKAVLAAAEPKDRERLVQAEADKYHETLRRTLVTVASDSSPPDRVREAVRKEIETQLDAEPVRRLADYLSRPKAPEAGIVEASLGRLDPTLLDEHGQPFRLDRKTLVEDYGPDIVKQLPRGATVEKGGAPADFLASRFGFPDAASMIDALRTMGDREATVEARVQDRLHELYPAVAENPAAVVQAAIDAEHSPKAVEAALEGARLLVRQVDPSLGDRLKVMENAAVRKQTADRLISTNRVADALPERFLQAERKYAKEALELTAKALGKNEARAKEYAAQAMDARDAQLLNMELYRAARDARKESAGAVEYLASMTRSDARKELGKATSSEVGPDGKTYVTQPYLDRMDDLLGWIDLRKSGAQTDRAKRFGEWLDAQPPDAQEDIRSRVSPSLIAGLDKTTNWRDLTVQDLRDLRAAAETIEAQAKLKSKLRSGVEERDREIVIHQAVSEIRARSTGGEVTRLPRTEGVLPRIGAFVRDVRVKWLQRPEETYRQLGPTMQKYGYDAISDADVKYRQLVRDVTVPIMKEIEGLPRSERKALRQKITIGDMRLDGEAALAVALHHGNESNEYKLLAGEAKMAGRFERGNGLTPDAVDQVLKWVDQKRSRWELVQRVWNQLSSKWQEMADIEKAHTGLAPPKIEPKPFTRTLADGTTIDLQGGYYPMVYDFRFSTAGQRTGEGIESGLQAMAFLGERAVTPQGHLQARIETFARPVDLSLAALPRHVTESMKDLAMRDLLISVRDLLTDGRVRDAIQDTLGPAAYSSLLQHWRERANEAAIARGNWRLLTRVRSAAAGGSIAWNIPVAAQHITNIIPTWDRVPAKYLAPAIAEFGAKRWSLLEDTIYPLSSYMYERIHEGDPTIRRSLAELTGKQSKIESLSEDIREVGMLPIHIITGASAAAGWKGAYDHAIAPKEQGGLDLLAGKDGPAAHYADSIVRQTQTSYRSMDRSLVERNPMTKPFTMFYGFISSQLNMLISAHADARLQWHQGFRSDAIRRIAKSYGIVMATGVLAEALVGQGPSPDEETGDVGPMDWAKWVPESALMYLPSLLPFGRSAMNAATGKQGRDMSFTPWMHVGQAAVNTVRDVKKAASDEAVGDEVYKAGLEALSTFGWWYGLPVTQLRRTGDYWLDISPEGPIQSQESEQASAPEALYGTLYGPKRPGRMGVSIFGPER
jgi:hypothetical protein